MHSRPHNGGPGRWHPGSLLALLDAPARAALLTLGRHEEFETGRALLHQGDPSTRVYALLTGTAKVTVTTEGGDDAFIALRVAGDVVGEMAMLSGSPRSATVTVISPVVARVIEAVAFREFLDRYPAANTALQAMLADRLRSMMDDRAALTGSTLVRLSRLLLRLSSSHGRSFPRGVVIGLPLSQRDLAGLINAAEVSVQRGISRLRADGILAESARGGLVIKDEAGLRRVAHGVGVAG
ncbi:Crp/Fnr family transcriptional regulator [Frankia tisae]|uniref:Crp/Fnr family transcriptional regulator n=1 Tax=Frankia tisae TaxID=2950104 RepID=UPI0021BEF9E8|nr:Crp/Fnr family transcriptional regulator [Frankia tisae]